MPTFKSPVTIPHNHNTTDVTGLTSWMGEVQKEFDKRDARITSLQTRVDQLTWAIFVLVLFASTISLLVLVNS